MTSLGQRIRLMADYGSFPLWHEDGPELGDIDPATLPISEALRAELNGWADQYQATLNEDDPAASGFETEAEEEQFKAEGGRLLEQGNRVGDCSEFRQHITQRQSPAAAGIVSFDPGR